MTTSANNAWIEMSNCSANTIYDIYGVYKNRYSLFESRCGKMLLYDRSNETGPLLIPDTPNGELVLLDGAIYVFEKSHINRRVKRLCLSSTLLPKSTSTPSPTSVSISNYVWETVGPIMKFFPRRAVSVEGSIYVLGLEYGEMYHYNPRTKELSKTSSMPKERTSHIFLAAGSRIYTIGERRYGGHKLVPTVDVFDTSSQTWSKAPPLPKAIKEGAATTVLDRWIVFTGGYVHYPDNGNYELNRKIYVFDTFRQEWSENHIELSLPRKMHKCVMVGSHMFCIGGNNDGTSWLPIKMIHISHIIPDWTYERIKHFILMRELVDKKRATPIMFYKKPKKDRSFKTYEETQKVMQRLITDTSLDVFRNVILFLTYPRSQDYMWGGCPAASKGRENEYASSDNNSEYDGSTSDEEWLY